MNRLLRLLHRWTFPVSAVIILIVALIAFRQWMETQLDAPVSPEFVEFLDVLAEHSGRASAYRASYYHHFARSTVAAQHFEQVCATMLRMAEAEGAMAPTQWATMAKGCRKLTPKYASDALPRA